MIVKICSSYSLFEPFLYFPINFDKLVELCWGIYLIRFNNAFLYPFADVSEANQGDSSLNFKLPYRSHAAGVRSLFTTVVSIIFSRIKYWGSSSSDVFPSLMRKENLRKCFTQRVFPLRDKGKPWKILACQRIFFSLPWSVIFHPFVLLFAGYVCIDCLNKMY